MFTSNPFAELSAFIPPIVMQTYVVVLILLVAGGTVIDAKTNYPLVGFNMTTAFRRFNIAPMMDGMS